MKIFKWGTKYLRMSEGVNLGVPDLVECEANDPDPVKFIAFEDAPVAAQAQPDLIRFDYVNADGQPDSKMITHDEMRARYAELTQQPVSGADGLTSLVDAAMTEMKGIHPPLKRSDCARLIGAALAQQDADKVDAERWQTFLKTANQKGGLIVRRYAEADLRTLPAYQSDIIRLVDAARKAQP